MCRILKRSFVTEPIPIIVLLDPAEEADRVAVLELGADDCRAKPYSFRELTLRIKCSLGRSLPHLAQMIGEFESKGGALLVPGQGSEKKQSKHQTFILSRISHKTKVGRTPLL